MPVRSNIATIPMAIDSTRRADLSVGTSHFVPGQLPVKLASAAKGPVSAVLHRYDRPGHGDGIRIARAWPGL
jgi:hypothetical protein